MSDSELVKRFLKLVEGLTVREIQGLTDNQITSSRVSHWRQGKFTSLGRKNRRYLEVFVADPPTARIEAYRSGRSVIPPAAADASPAAYRAGMEVGATQLRLVVEAARKALAVIEEELSDTVEAGTHDRQRATKAAKPVISHPKLQKRPTAPQKRKRA